MMQKINESKSWFFDRINKIDTRLTRLTKKKRERTQIYKIRNERIEVTTDTIEMQRFVRNCYEQIYAKKLDKLSEVDKFLETYNLPNLNQEEAENLHRLITTSETEAVIQKLLAHKSLGPDGSTGKFYQSFKEELTPIPKNSRSGKTSKLFLWSKIGRYNKDRKLQASISDEHRC